MKTTALKITRIGNSRGVRLPAAALKRYAIEDTVIMEERSDGILLRVPGPATRKLSWDDTALAMAAASEDWSEWDATSSDGTGAVPWHPADVRKVAESKSPYRARKSQGRKK